ncbi:3-oxoadipate enol-lactonase [Amycolatopsis nigrescens]|uniref:3-oxoadipate enol-lactonase n=1 Tax=Amycolatopsis nigrescens TaxID=381445 RepID=UPI000371FC06|nr:3-oxoadipate enol-lactonase [Amycolatopsis nigrescens]
MSEISGAFPHYVLDGQEDGPVVLLSNSLGSDLRMWDPQVGPLVSAGFRVLRYDHRGHGGSPAPPGPYTLDDLGADLTGLLDRLGVPRAHLAGLSLGGMVAMHVAARAPERVASLVLCCTSAKLGPPSRWSDRAAAVRAGGTTSIADGAIGRWLTPGYAAAHPDTVAVLREMIETTSDEGYASCCGVIERMDQLDALGRISAPTLVISAAEDQATPPEHGRRIADGIRGARLEIVPGAAHLGSFEQPERFGELMVQHFRQSGDPR